MKKVLIILSVLLLVVAAFILITTFSFKSIQKTYPAVPKLSVDNSVIERLGASIRMKTISFEDTSQFDSLPFKNFHRFLEDNYPLCHSNLKKEVISDLSLVYTWEGSDKSLKPAILLAHMDVVPAEGNWTKDAFSGLIENGYIWGRGSMDDKVALLSIFEASEMLIKNNFTPKRTIYFAFGHDEELMGSNGAKKIGEWMKGKNIQAEFILDEGLVITEGIVPGMDRAVALVGIAEKGYLTLKLSTHLDGGHSSMPAKETAIGVLSSALSKIQEEPLPARLTEPALQFMKHIGPEMPFANRMAFANSWLFENIIIGIYEKTPSGNALVRTTIAPTIFKSGIKQNVIPNYAEAIVNLRTLPGESDSMLINIIREKMADNRIKVDVINSINSSPVSTTASAGYQELDKAIRQVFPDVLVAPSLMIAGTDSKHYQEISPNIYRFLPLRLRKEDLKRIHGEDERISEEGYKDVIRFYYQLIRNN